MTPRVLLILAMTAASGCRSGGAGPSSEGTADVGGDADALTPEDTLPDARDAIEASDEPDTAFDAAVMEAGEDPPFMGTWKGLPGAPSLCGAILSAEPAKAAPPFKWIPCPSGRSGCRVLSVDWPTPPKFEPLAPETFRPVFVNDGVPYLSHLRWLAKTPDDGNHRVIFAVQGFDRPAALVLRYDDSKPHCYFAQTSMGPSGYGAWGSTSTGDSRFVVQAPWPTLEPIAKTVSKSVLGVPPSADVHRTAVGVGSLFLEANTPDGILTYSLATGAVSTLRAAAEMPIGVVDGAIALSWTKPGIALVRPDASTIHLVVPETSKLVTSIAVDRAKSDTLVWVESTPDPKTGLYLDPVVWTSPYAADPSKIVRKRVGAYKDSTGYGGQYSAVNAGMALIRTGDATAILMRLSDGMSWSIAPEPGQIFAGPGYETIWVDDTEMIFGTKPTGVGFPITSLLRIRRDTLGTPTIPPG